MATGMIIGIGDLLKMSVVLEMNVVMTIAKVTMIVEGQEATASVTVGGHSPRKAIGGVLEDVIDLDCEAQVMYNANRLR